jgi:hypothetical protein
MRILSSNNDNPDDSINIINQLDIADGLKDLIINHDLSLETILNTSTDDLARILGIDQQVVELICAAAKKQNKMLESMR